MSGQNEPTPTPLPTESEASTEKTDAVQPSEPADEGDAVTELGGPKGPEPTRFGDWERAGRCSDF